MFQRRIDKDVPLLVSLTRGLSPGAKRRLADELRKAPLVDPQLKLLVPINLGDRRAWSELIEEVVVRGADETRQNVSNHVSVDLMLSAARHATPHLRQDLLRMLLKRYPSADKHVQRDAPILKLPPRRVLDQLWQELVQPARGITKEVKRGASVEDAYDLYLKGTSRSFGHTPYGLREIRMVAAAVQEVLKDKRVQSRLSFLCGEPAEIIIGGSLPTGKARIETSDLDIVDPRATFPEDILAKITTRVRSVFAKASLSVDMKAELAGGRVSAFTTEEMAPTTPLFLRIRTDGVELQAYDGIHNIHTLKISMP
jgi:hypothetical protein